MNNPRTDNYWRPSRRQAECMLFVAWNDRPRSYHNRNIHGPLVPMATPKRKIIADLLCLGAALAFIIFGIGVITP